MAESQHSILPLLIVVINWGCLLILVIASPNHKRHRQGWHSSGRRRRPHLEFADTLHHLPTELEAGGGEKNARLLISASDRKSDTHKLTMSLEVVRKRPSAEMGKQEAKKKGGVSVNGRKIGTLGEVYSNGPRY